MEMQELVSPPDRGNDPDSQAALAEAWSIERVRDWPFCILSLRYCPFLHRPLADEMASAVFLISE